MRKHFSALAAYSANQGLVQLISFIVGILAVRSLAKDDYAVYALTVSVIAAIVVIADSGLGGALLARGAEAIGQPKRLASVFGTGLWVRTWLGSVILVSGLVWLTILLQTVNADLLLVGACVAIAALTVALQLSSGVAQAFARLVYNIKLMRRTNLVSAMIRLLLVGAAVLTGIQSPPVLLAAAGIASAVALVMYYLPFQRQVRPTFTAGDDRGYFVSVMARTMPMMVLLVAGEQMLLFLISTLGGAQVVAEFSALSRFGILFLVLNSLVTDIGAPRFARVRASRQVLIARGGQVLGGYALGATVLVLLLVACAPLVIWILGPQYSGLESQLVLVACGYALANVAHAWNGLNQARGWVSFSWLYLPFIGVWVVVAVTMYDLSDLTQVAIVLILQAVPALATQLARSLVGLATSRKT